MQMLRILLKKEFLQIIRDKTILGMVIMAPIVQLCVLPFAADYEMKNIDITIVDRDHSSLSQQLIHKIPASGYFKITGFTDAYSTAMRSIEEDKTNIILEIPHNFEKNLKQHKPVSLFMAVNAIKGPQAVIGGSYLVQILQDFNRDINVKRKNINEPNAPPTINASVRNWFNPHLDYHLLMVPGILALLMTLVGGILTSLNIVREKEGGTIEQINVSPIKKYQYILGKIIPFWILGMIVFTIGLFIAWLVYGIVAEGSIGLLYVFVAVYLLAITGFGLLVSTWADTQQQSMLIMFFFMMIFVLMSGLFTPIDSMPAWAQYIAYCNPVTYLIKVLRMIILKGSTFMDMLPQMAVIAIFAILLNSLAVWSYRKVS